MDHMRAMLADVYKRASKKWEPSDDRTPIDALRKALVDGFNADKATMYQLVAVMDIMAEDAGPMAAWYLYDNGGIPKRAANIAWFIANWSFNSPERYELGQQLYDISDEDLETLVSQYRE